MQEETEKLCSSSSQFSLQSGHRVFYNIPEKPADIENSKLQLDFISNNANGNPQYAASVQTYYTELFAYIEKNIIGRDKWFRGPFGERPIVYCDYTASGKCLKFIEEFIYHEVLPEYANTHTTNTVTSLQTTMYRHEARDIIRNSCQASEHDAVIFVGSGCTAAIHKLIHNIHLQKSPIVIVGPFEHHSNLLPWRHMAYSVDRAEIDIDGSINTKKLEDLLKEKSKIAKDENRQLIGVFAAVSNVTGIISNVNNISIIMHRYGGLVFWDYASGAPYIPIDMNPVITGPDRELVYKDAVYFSMHKFVGGVQAPGVLIAKKTIFRSGEQNPEGTGGGTVFFVRRENQIYLKDVEEREEGGTPDIVGSIRAGLTFQLKESATTDAIVKRENYLVKLAWSRFSSYPSNFIVLGGNATHRLPIFSFMIRHEVESKKYLYLHHNFICTLLNDLFGIQARSGCACAGPYAMDLIGIDEKLAKRIESVLVGNGMEQTVLTKYFEYPHREIIRPGFVRINLPYFMPDIEVNFVLDVLDFVTRNGYKFLPFYKFNPVTSDWRHRSHDLFKDRKWLGHVSYKRGYMTWRRPHYSDTPNSPPTNTPNSTQMPPLKDLLKSAQDIINDLLIKPIDIPDESTSFDLEIGRLRWFWLPAEIATILWNSAQVQQTSYALFTPGSISNVFEGKGNEVKIIQLSNTSTNNYIQQGISEMIPINVEVVEEFKENGSRIINKKNYTKFANQVIMPPNDDSENNNIENENNHNHVNENNNGSSEIICSLKTKNYIKKQNPKFKTNLNKGYIITERNKLKLWKNPPKELYKPFLKAINDFHMIKNNDKLLICVSGGKDSLSLLHCIKQYQYYINKKIKFDFSVITIDPGSNAYNPKPLIDYYKELDINYYYEEQNIIDKALDLSDKCDSICSFCSRLKRGRIYKIAKQYNYNVVVLGQHLDDICESLFMSMFHNGLIRSMKANYKIMDGNLRVIRPLVYCREKHTRSFADKAKLPVIPENCPACFEAPKERFRIKMMLAEQEVLFPNLYNSLLSSIKPILSIKTANFNLLALIENYNKIKLTNKLSIDKVQYKNDDADDDYYIGNDDNIFI